jgi:hypothetical protein
MAPIKDKYGKNKLIPAASLVLFSVPVLTYGKRKKEKRGRSK